MKMYLTAIFCKFKSVPKAVQKNKINKSNRSDRSRQTKMQGTQKTITNLFDTYSSMPYTSLKTILNHASVRSTKYLLRICGVWVIARCTFRFNLGGTSLPCDTSRHAFSYSGMFLFLKYSQSSRCRGFQ